MGRRQKGNKKGANEEDNDVNADYIPSATRKIVQSLKNCFPNRSEEDIYATLVECDNKSYLASIRLHSQALSSKGERKQGEKREVYGTTAGILGPYKSDLTNVKSESTVPISSGEAVPSMQRPATIIPPGPLMVDVLKKSLGLSSKESVTEATVKDDSPLHEKPVPDATNPSANPFTESDAARDQLGESPLVYDYKFPVDEEVTNPVNYAFTNFAARSDQLQASTSEPNLQMHGLYIPPGAVQQQAYTREPDLQYSTRSFNQSVPTGQHIPTAFSQGRMPSFPMTEGFINSTNFEPQGGNQQEMNRYYPQHQVPSWQYGNNMMTSPYRRPNQNDSYNMLPSAANQQHDGSNNNTYLLQSLDSVSPQYSNSNLPQSATSIGPSAHGSAYGSTFGSAYGPAFGSAYGSAYGSASGSAFGSPFGSADDFVAWSGNAANPSFGYDNVSSNHLPSFPRQGGNSNAWSFGEGSYRVNPLHQRSPSFRHSQQEQQPYGGIGQERSNAYYTSQNQQINRSNPYDQTQQQQWRRNNH